MLDTGPSGSDDYAPTPARSKCRCGKSVGCGSCSEISCYAYSQLRDGERGYFHSIHCESLSLYAVTACEQGMQPETTLTRCSYFPSSASASWPQLLTEYTTGPVQTAWPTSEPCNDCSILQTGKHLSCVEPTTVGECRNSFNRAQAEAESSAVQQLAAEDFTKEPIQTVPGSDFCGGGHEEPCWAVRMNSALGRRVRWSVTLSAKEFKVGQGIRWPGWYIIGAILFRNRDRQGFSVT
jgi:hypothetical protein